MITSTMCYVYLHLFNFQDPRPSNFQTRIYDPQISNQIDAPIHSPHYFIKSTVILFYTRLFRRLSRDSKTLRTSTKNPTEFYYYWWIV